MNEFPSFANLYKHKDVIDSARIKKKSVEKEVTLNPKEADKVNAGSTVNQVSLEKSESVSEAEAPKINSGNTVLDMKNLI